MAISVVKLNDYLSGNIDAIETLLHALDCCQIHYNPNKREFRCAREFGKNPSAVRVKADNLRFSCFSTNEQGSIYNLIMNKTGMSFPMSLQWAVDILELEKNHFGREDEKKKILPFGGFYKKIIKNNQEPELHLTTYPESILENYGNHTNLAFLRDGIDLLTQEKFHLGYDFDTHRITIPQWDVVGNLIGVMGRSNDIDIPHEYRWLPIIPCSRSSTLFGYHINYSAIQQQQLAIITESEKGVMQMASMGYHYGLATCTKSISMTQAKYLKALRIDKIIIAYDEGVTEEELRMEANKIKMCNPICTNQVGYIYDKAGNILKAGSKSAPTDVGRSKFKELVNTYTKWI